MRLALSLIALPFALSACASMSTSEDLHRAVCNQLKSDMVFNGATPNTRKAEIQNAQLPLQQKNYDQHCE